MKNDHTPDLVNECNVVFEYGQAMAAAAESLLRYTDRMQAARSEAERAFIRASHATLVKRTIVAHRIAIAAMTAQPNERKEINMPHWVKLVLAGLGVAGAGIATAATGGGALVIAAAVVSASGGALATLYHPAPGSDK